MIRVSLQILENFTDVAKFKKTSRRRFVQGFFFQNAIRNT